MTSPDGIGTTSYIPSLLGPRSKQLSVASINTAIRLYGCIVQAWSRRIRHSTLTLSVATAYMHSMPFSTTEAFATFDPMQGMSLSTYGQAIRDLRQRRVMSAAILRLCFARLATFVITAHQIRRYLGSGMKRLFKSVLHHANKTGLLYDKLCISTRKPVSQGTAQPAAVADRFAREIGGILAGVPSARGG
jgi:hypothetical protein